jgi:hypothetical protein
VTNMTDTKKSPLSQMPRKYKFVLNPYPEMRLSSCPFCDRKTGQRKIPLLIHVDPNNLISLNYTCRYCQACDLLIAHKHEIEHLLTILFRQRAPEVIGNEYLIMGTMDKAAWRENMRQPKEPREALSQANIFLEYYQELRTTRPGWYPEDRTPPIAEPPASQEWVKLKNQRKNKL